MTNYLPYILGFCSLIGGIYLLLYSFQIYKPKHKSEERTKRYAKSIKKFGTLMKICSIILILNGLYDLIKRDPSRYKIDLKTNSEWTQEDKDVLIKNCMRDAGATNDYDQSTKDYCDCSTNKITEAMTKEQYKKSLLKTQEEQVKEILPVIQSCLTELNQRKEKEAKQ